MDTKSLKLYRKRYIPNEFLHLKDDEILYCDDKMLVTRWNTLHCHQSFAGGTSIFFLDRGWKISRIIDHNGRLLHWYCDIASNSLDKEQNSFLCTDLLFDIIVYPDGSYTVLDCDEAADAFSQGLITADQLTFALRNLQDLLRAVHSRFNEITSLFDPYCK